MSGELNIKIIQGVYEAFGRGDVAAVLDAVAEDVDWAAEAAGSGAPWYGVRHGKGEVVKFFEAFGTAMEVEEWTPLAYAASDADVHAVVRASPWRRTCTTSSRSATARSSTTAAPRTPRRPRRRCGPDPAATAGRPRPSGYLPGSPVAKRDRRRSRTAAHWSRERSPSSAINLTASGGPIACFHAAELGKFPGSPVAD